MADDDEFADLSKTAMKATAAGAADVLEEAIGAVAGPILDATFSVFESLAERNDKAIAAHRLSAVEDEVIALRDELRALKQALQKAGREPDRADPLTQAAVASDFVRDVSHAKTVEKREALVHATAFQFDPRKGAASTRDYWLRRVRSLSEADLGALLLLAMHGAITFMHKPLVVRAAAGMNKAQFTEISMLPEG